MKREVMRDEERKRVADSKVSAKMALRKMRSLELERQRAKELELLKSGPPKEKLRRKETRSVPKSEGHGQDLREMRKKRQAEGWEGCQAHPRAWRGYKAGRRPLSVSRRASSLCFFKTEEVMCRRTRSRSSRQPRDPVCATIQPAWRRYRKRMMKRYLRGAVGDVVAG